MLPGSIAFYGASSTYGAGDPDGGYVVRFRRWYCGNRKNSVVYNLGIPAENTDSLVKRFVDENARRDPNLVIFHLGTNDSCREGMDGEVAVPISRYTENVKFLFAEALKSAAVGAITSFPINESMNPHGIKKKHKTSYYFNEDIARHKSKLLEIAREFDVPVIDLFDGWKHNDQYRYYLIKDGLHANPDGHAKINNLLQGFVKYYFDRFEKEELN